MNNETTLHLIATNHAMAYAEKHEPWQCDCIACKFTKEYKIPVLQENGTIKEITMAETLTQVLNEQGFM
jgi:hypothetical protein